YHSGFDAIVERRGGPPLVFMLTGRVYTDKDRYPLVMYNTSFIRSNILLLIREEIDTLWDAKGHLPKDFKAEEESTLVKIDIRCRVQGDVVLKCIHLDEDLIREEMMFRVMYNTSFIRSNILLGCVGT
ncbi:hypothetical protein IFM89_036983, partial [Coptis chinensis]